MAGEKIPEHITAEEQEPAQTPIETSRVNKYGTTKYQDKYPLLCFNLLSKASTAKTKSHCCALLQCSRPTLLRWMKTYPEFNDAIIAGLEIGKAKWRDRLAKFAFQPSAKVNNGLIKLLSSNVYGIKEELDPAVVVNNNVDTDPEMLLKNRGIPIPKIDNEDLDE